MFAQHVCVCVCVHMHLYVCGCGGQRPRLGKVLHWTRSSLTQLDFLSSKLSVSFWVYFTRALRLWAHAAISSLFMWAPGIKLMSSSFPCKYFIDWVISLGSGLPIFKTDTWLITSIVRPCNSLATPWLWKRLLLHWRVSEQLSRNTNIVSELTCWETHVRHITSVLPCLL